MCDSIVTDFYYLCLCVAVKFPCGIRKTSPRIYVRSLSSASTNRPVCDGNVTSPRVPISNQTVSQKKGKIAPSRSKLPTWFYNSTEWVNNRTRIIGGNSASPGDIPWQVQSESGQFHNSCQ